MTRRLKWAIYTSTGVRLVLIKVLFSTHFHQILHSNGVHFRAVKLFQNMLHRLQLGPRSTPGGLQTRVEFPLHDDSVWEMEDIPKNGHDFYNNETTQSLKKNARYLTTIQKGKHGRVGLQLSNFCNLVFGYNWHHTECGNQKRS